MRNGYNQNLATQILIEKEQRELQIRFDHKGNVIRDYAQEIRILAESETKNSLPELPVAIFDGCRKFSEHIKNEKTGSVVRIVKLAPLESKPIQRSIFEICLGFVERIISKFSNPNKNLPIFNQGKQERKGWMFNNIVERYAFTGNYKKK